MSWGPDAIERLLADTMISVGAGRAVAAHGGGIAAGGRPRAYVREAAVDALRERYRLVDDVEGNVDLAVIPASAVAGLPEPGVFVPPAVAWLDLLDDPDSRARSAAREWGEGLPRSVVVLDGRRRH